MDIKENQVEFTLFVMNIYYVLLTRELMEFVWAFGRMMCLEST